MALAAGDSWVGKGDNLLVFGQPGGKSRLAAAIVLDLIENGWRVLFAPTTGLVQKLQAARHDARSRRSPSSTTRRSSIGMSRAIADAPASSDAGGPAGRRPARQSRDGAR